MVFLLVARVACKHSCNTLGKDHDEGGGTEVNYDKSSTTVTQATAERRLETLVLTPFGIKEAPRAKHLVVRTHDKRKTHTHNVARYTAEWATSALLRITKFRKKARTQNSERGSELGHGINRQNDQETVHAGEKRTDKTHLVRKRRRAPVLVLTLVEETAVQCPRIVPEQMRLSETAL